MVRFVVKKDGICQFLYQAPINTLMSQVYEEITAIQNNRTKIKDLCYELEQLAKHGPVLPLDMQGLAPGQAEELALTDEWADKCVPSDGYTLNPDPLQCRNGRQPSEKMRDVLLRAVEEAKTAVAQAQMESEVFMTLATISQALHTLRGGVLVVYPMGLPPHDKAHVSLEDCEEPAKCNTDHRDMLAVTSSVIWFCGRALSREGNLAATIKSNNDKTRVTVVLTGPGTGPPAREPAINEEEKAKMLAYYHRKQEELEVMNPDQIAS